MGSIYEKKGAGVWPGGANFLGKAGMNTWWKLGLAVPVLGLLFGLLAAPQPASAQKKAPRFFVANMDGERFYSRKQKKPFIISFFFVDCVPCKKEIPQLHKLMTTEYKENGLLFIDPIGDDSPEYILDFAAQLGVPGSFFYRDPLARLAKKFFKGQLVFPTIVGIKKGKIVMRVLDLSPKSVELLRKTLE